MKIFVLRHGQTKENITGVMQGLMETVLDDLGKEQAISRREDVLRNHIDLVICSPRIRTKETAELAAPNIPLIVDDRLRSRNHGEFQGMRRDEIDFENYWNYKINKQYESAESVGDLFNRIDSLLKEIKEKYSDKNVLLVTHSGICRILYYYFNGIPEDGELMGYKSTNCSFEQYEL